ncbi:hypothetical protein BpHYR1_034208 [Brachionus plicatilis]|uniref:Uncharacterized protein n=1 Tax=Brachionus plicatilis TaxID=10195 RepID=A0A3M7SLV0_BRAPC|nr:hypothetical protein BpHYR1_034208 [Brachionus plicatilis]
MPASKLTRLYKFQVFIGKTGTERILDSSHLGKPIFIDSGQLDFKKLNILIILFGGTNAIFMKMIKVESISFLKSSLLSEKIQNLNMYYLKNLLVQKLYLLI